MNGKYWLDDIEGYSISSGIKSRVPIEYVIDGLKHNKATLNLGGFITYIEDSLFKESVQHLQKSNEGYEGKYLLHQHDQYLTRNLL